LRKFEVIRFPKIIMVTLIFAIASITLFRKRKSSEAGSIYADPKKYRNMVLIYIEGLILASLRITSKYWVASFFEGEFQ